VTLLIRAILGDADAEPFSQRHRDVLAVGSEEAQRRRLRGVTAAGTNIATDLPRQSFLRHGAVLHDDGERIIVVERSPEPALVVRLDESLPAHSLLEQGVRIGHWAGNQHLFVETAGHEIRVRIATAPELILSAARALNVPGAELTIAEVPFAREGRPSVPHGHG
jgi:urease accessory protein